MISCSESTSNFTDEELAVIIADMHITENAIMKHDVDLRDSLSELYMEKLEEIHKHSREEIKYEIELLMDNPKRQSEVYSLVISKLQDIEKEVKEKDKAAKEE